jgi:hypothetical protein
MAKPVSTDPARESLDRRSPTAAGDREYRTGKGWLERKAALRRRDLSEDLVRRDDEPGGSRQAFDAINLLAKRMLKHPGGR